MNSPLQPGPRAQRGAATLAVSLLILFLITLITLYTANTAVLEQQISANKFRADEALAAANAALDAGIAYYDDGGLDHDGNGAPDFTCPDATPVCDVDNAATVSRVPDPEGLGRDFAVMYFCDRDDPAFLDPAKGEYDYDLTEPPACNNAIANPVVVGVGFSEDQSARHTIVVQLGGLELLGEGGPDSPLIAHGGVGLTGNVTIINRYTNSTIWSGYDVTIGQSVSASTYILDPGIDRGTLTRAQLTDTDETNNSALVSGRERGNNMDVIDHDANLASLEGDQFFENFFTEGKDRVAIYANNIDQRFEAAQAPDLDGMEGLIWIDGDYQLNGGVIGTLQNPAILIVDGNLQTGGNVSLIGTLYVVGNWTVGGTVNVRGAAIVEGRTVDGNGALELVYDAELYGGGGTPASGTTGIIQGSWRDF